MGTLLTRVKDEGHELEGGGLSRTLVMLRPPVQECFHHHFLFRFSKPVSDSNVQYTCKHTPVLPRSYTHIQAFPMSAHCFPQVHTHTELHKYSLTHTTDSVNSAPRLHSPAFEKPMRTVCVDAGRAQGIALCLQPQHCVFPTALK